MIYTDRLRAHLENSSLDIIEQALIAICAVKEIINFNADMDVLKFCYLNIAEAEKSLKYDCKAGCNSCCTKQVSCSPIEAKYLLDNCDRSFLVKNKEKLKRQHDNFLELPTKDQQCIFLTNEGCSVYQYRPFSCRLYYSGSVDICLQTGTKDNMMSLIGEIVHTAYMQLIYEKGFKPSSDYILYKWLYREVSLL